MRGDYEAKNDRHPFQVQYIGLGGVGIRNLTTGEVVGEVETKHLGAHSKAQWDRLDSTALALARANRDTSNAPAPTGGETLAECSARMLGAVH